MSQDSNFRVNAPPFWKLRFLGSHGLGHPSAMDKARLQEFAVAATELLVLSSAELFAILGTRPGVEPAG